MAAVDREESGAEIRNLLAQNVQRLLLLLDVLLGVLHEALGLERRLSDNEVGFVLAFSYDLLVYLLRVEQRVGKRFLVAAVFFQLGNDDFDLLYKLGVIGEHLFVVRGDFVEEHVDLFHFIAAEAL